MKSGDKKALGRWGERVAIAYLKRQGYEILNQNFYCRCGELDIIASREDTLCFIEVKTRTGMCYGLPCEAVTQGKKRHILQTISYYRLCHPSHFSNLRVDVIEILRLNGKTYINHLKNVALLSQG